MQLIKAKKPRYFSSPCAHSSCFCCCCCCFNAGEARREQREHLRLWICCLQKIHVKGSRAVLGVGGEGGLLEDLAKDQRKRRGPSLELVGSSLSPKTKPWCPSPARPGSGGAALAPGPVLPIPGSSAPPHPPRPPGPSPPFRLVIICQCGTGRYWENSANCPGFLIWQTREPSISRQ